MNVPHRGNTHIFVKQTTQFPLEVFSVRVDRAWRNLIYWNVSLPIAEDWKWTVFKVPPNLNCSVILN